MIAHVGPSAPDTASAASPPEPFDGGATTAQSGRGGGVPSLVRAIRPQQWIKNVLVAAAPAAAGALLSSHMLTVVAAVAVAMCLAAGATYLVNDISDRERDRLHPTKCRRPIAAGELSVPAACLAATVMAIGSLAIGLGLGAGTAGAILTYLVLTVSYSRWLKHLPVAELGFVAAGFMLRVMAGAAATAVELSLPFLVVIGAGALFLAVGKRYSELIDLGPDAARHRPVLRSFTPRRLEGLLWASLSTAVGAYALWAMSVEMGGTGKPWLLLSIAPTTLAAGRSAQQVFSGHGGDPTALVLHDRPLQMAAACAALLVFAGIYLV